MAKRRIPMRLRTRSEQRAAFRKLKAVRMVKEAGFKATKIDETRNTYRFRQEDPGRLKKGTFRIKDIGRKGFIKIVVAKPKGRNKTKVQSVIVEKKDLK
jgi:hypothetical protein